MGVLSQAGGEKHAPMLQRCRPVVSNRMPLAGRKRFDLGQEIFLPSVSERNNL
jgi:hypothetical protein